MSQPDTKLDMDLPALPSLRSAMAEQDDQADTEELVGQIFYLLTARFEDGAAMAAEGQASGRAPDTRVDLAKRLHSLAPEAIILADTIVALNRLAREDGITAEKR